MVDPPLWATTRYLLEGASRDRMLSLLDELLSQDVDRTLPEPSRRALLQHELWQVFDWTLKNDWLDKPARIELRKKIAAAIPRLALSKAQIGSLPSGIAPWIGGDTPPDFRDPTQGWISLGIPGSQAVAEAHMKLFGGRSAFGVFFHDPGGPAEAEKYLKRLAGAGYPPTTQPARHGLFAPDVPQFLKGTQLGLLRRMMLIDSDGQIVCSPIIQSIQVRTFQKIEPRTSPGDVPVQEFVLDRSRYLAGEKCALQAIRPDDREPTIFMSKEIDQFVAEQNDSRQAYSPPGKVLESCATCHGGPGVVSMLSYVRFFSSSLPVNVRLQGLGFEREAAITADWKQQQASWGMLRGYWEAAGPTPSR